MACLVVDKLFVLNDIVDQLFVLHRCWSAVCATLLLISSLYWTIVHQLFVLQLESVSKPSRESQSDQPSQVDELAMLKQVFSFCVIV